MVGGKTGCRTCAWLEYVIGKQKGFGWLTWLTTLIPMRFGLPGQEMFEFPLYDAMRCAQHVVLCMEGDKSCIFETCLKGDRVV